MMWLRTHRGAVIEGGQRRALCRSRYHSRHHTIEFLVQCIDLVFALGFHLLDFHEQGLDLHMQGAVPVLHHGFELSSSARDRLMFMS